MINLLVDEGYAYDVLAISKVKCINNLPNASKNFLLISECLKNQIKDLHEEILLSVEFLDLLNANIKTFDAVEKARYSSITAKEVDDLNMERFYCKQKLQKKFFPTSVMLENKS